MKSIFRGSNEFKVFLAMELSSFILIVIALNMNLISVAFSIPAEVKDDLLTFKYPLEQREQSAAIRMLAKSLPLYAASQLDRSDIDPSQKESIKLLYMPVVDRFIKTEDVGLLLKAEAILTYIVAGNLRVSGNEPE